MVSKFEFKTNTVLNSMNIVVRGSYTQEDARDFISEYQKQIKSINPPKFDLVVDCLELNVSKSDVVPMLQGCFEMYKKDGFKKIQCKITNNVTLKMQANRLARTVGLENFEVLE